MNDTTLETEKSPREIARTIAAQLLERTKATGFDAAEAVVLIEKALRDRDEHLHLLIVSALRDTKENFVSINRALEIINHAIKQD